MSKLNEIAEKKVIILGLGREGISTYYYLRSKLPNFKLTLADKKNKDELDQLLIQKLSSDQNVALQTGSNYLQQLDTYDIIFKSPGISHILPEIQSAIHKGCLIYSNTALFFDEFSGTIIGITGTKGKSTTTRLIFDLLSNGGLKVKLMGNIGIPPLSTISELLEDTIVVIELSSHQLMDLRKSPHIAVLQGIFQEHLDYYSSFEEYIEAKRNIIRFQKENDYLIFNKDNDIASNLSNSIKSRKYSFGLNKEELNCYVKDGWLIYDDGNVYERIIETIEIPLIGNFNLLNVMPSIIIGKLFGISSKKLSRAIRNFCPLEHRLELVCTSLQNITFFNDSLATTPDSTINALASFPDKEIILITGGYDRNLDFHNLAIEICKSKVKVLILFPTTGERILNEINILKKSRDMEVFKVTTMAEAVSIAINKSEPNDVVLLSPASASFNNFIDYRDRGNQFKDLVIKELNNRHDI